MKNNNQESIVSENVDQLEDMEQNLSQTGFVDNGVLSFTEDEIFPVLKSTDTDILNSSKELSSDSDLKAKSSNKKLIVITIGILFFLILILLLLLLISNSNKQKTKVTIPEADETKVVLRELGDQIYLIDQLNTNFVLPPMKDFGPPN